MHDFFFQILHEHLSCKITSYLKISGV